MAAIKKNNASTMKYQLGDCLSFQCKENLYIAGFISGIFKSYYDITLIEYRDKIKPTLKDLINSRFFGTRFGSLDDISYAVDKSMISKKIIDKLDRIDLIGNLIFKFDLQKASYHYDKGIDELLHYYLTDLPIRIEKTTNAERFPEIGFGSKHLIKIKMIIKN